MPLWVMNAPTIFINLTYRIFASFLDKFVTVFIDNILVYSKNEEDYVSTVFETLKREKLYGEVSKC